METISSTERPVFLAAAGAGALLLILILAFCLRRKLQHRRGKVANSAHGAPIEVVASQEKKSSEDARAGPDAAAGDLEVAPLQANHMLSSGNRNNSAGAKNIGAAAEDRSLLRKLFGCLRAPQVLPEQESPSPGSKSAANSARRTSGGDQLLDLENGGVGQPSLPKSGEAAGASGNSNDAPAANTCSPEVQKLLRRLVEVIERGAPSDAPLAQRVEELEKQVLSLRTNRQTSGASPEGKQQQQTPGTPPDALRPVAPNPPACDPPLLPPACTVLPPVPSDGVAAAAAVAPQAAAWPAVAASTQTTPRPQTEETKLGDTAKSLASSNGSSSLFASLQGSDLERTQKLEFGASQRQLALPDGAEIHTVKGGGINEATTLRQSNESLKTQLRARDAQTQELHKQLREARKALLEHASEARTAEARLRGLVTGEGVGASGELKPASSTALEDGQKELVRQQQAKIEELSRKLHDITYQSMHWCTVAKRQRAFFLHSERVAESESPSEFLKCLKAHPAGEVFVPPPPCVLPDEDTGPAWDIGSSGANPYVVDSWPIEPNSQATRAARDAPAMGSWDEASEEDEDESDEDSAHGEGGAGGHNRRDSGPAGWNPAEGGSGKGMRLPQLPPLRTEGLQGLNADEDEDEDDDGEAPRPAAGPGGLAMPTRYEQSDTARSL